MGLSVLLSQARLLGPVSSAPHTNPFAGALANIAGAKHFPWHQSWRTPPQLWAGQRQGCVWWSFGRNRAYHTPTAPTSLPPQHISWAGTQPAPLPQCFLPPSCQTRSNGSHRKKPSQLNCVYLNYTGNHSVDDARQALALLVNSTDLPLLAFSVPAFFPTQELEGEKKKKKKEGRQTTEEKE